LQSHFDSGALVDLCPGQFIDVPLYWQINGIAAHQLTDLTNCIVTTARAWLDTGVDS
jgi:LysR family transcriptional regulator (chromosome initiation inhibitor)